MTEFIASITPTAPTPFIGFHHVTFWVSNALQASTYYCTRFGFEPFAFRGLETGHRDVCTRVIKKNNIIFVIEAPYTKDQKEMNDHLVAHGDGIRDIAFQVNDARKVYEKAISEGGAISVKTPTEESDESGTIIIASVKTYGDTIHSFIEYKNGLKRTNEKFLVNYRKSTKKDALLVNLVDTKLNFVDHCVGNMGEDGMEPVVKWYEKSLNFHRFWSVDDKTICTQYSCLKSIVVTDPGEVIRMPINEPAKGLRKSQIQEFVDYYDGPGVQHVALNTDDIVSAVKALRARGVQMLHVPSEYYINLSKRLQESKFCIKEDLKTLEELQILVDYDEEGYLLQLFTKPVQDRPTFFIEIIQRHNNTGFGAGNFKALFEAIEEAQAKRGNL